MEARVGRLKKRPEFQWVAAGRARWATPGLVLQARCRADAGHTGRRPAARPEPEGGKDPSVRVGFTVSRKVGNAVRRNRARRRLRAVAAEVLPEFGQPGTDYVIIGRAATPDRPYRALAEDLRVALRQLGEKWQCRRAIGREAEQPPGRP